MDAAADVLQRAEPLVRGDRPVTTLIERLDLPAALPRSRSRRDTETDTVQFAQAALAAAKQEGLQLAVRARYIALVVIACLLPIINPTWEQLYYVVLLGLFALIGWGQVKVGRVGVSRPELALLFCDLALLTFILVVPNPFSSAHWAVAMQYHFGNFIYFFVLLSGATLAYSWRTVIAVGTWTSALWIAGMVWVWWQPDRNPELTDRIAAATGDDQLEITLDIVPDEDEPYALLSARDAAGEQLAQVRVAASFKLTKASAAAWVENEFRRPG